MMNQFPKVLAVYTSRNPEAAVVFYQIRSARGYRELQSFFRTRKQWHKIDGWTDRTMRIYRQARLEAGLPTPLYTETNLGWAPVSEPQWPLGITAAEEQKFLPNAG